MEGITIMMKKILRLFCAALVFAMAMGSLAACGNGNNNSESNESGINETKYNEACALIESGDYESAYAAFKELGDYKDAQKHLSRFIYFPKVANFTFYDRSGVMTVEFGTYNMPSRIFTEGVEGTENEAYTKDGAYTYDNKGNLMRQAVLYNGTLMAYDYTYDNNSNLIKAEHSVEGVVDTVNGYVYDENGLLIREFYTEGDVVHYDYENFYDANGNLIKSEFKAQDVDYVYTYTYNDAGGLVNERGTVTNGYWYNIDYTYNADGQLTKQVYTSDDEDFYTTEYTYDNAGRCVKEETTDASDGRKEVFAQEYDANGNVTKEMLTASDGTVETVEWQYVLTYITIDVPVSTMSQLLGVFDII
jgi:YD repeat-containing protein